MLFMGLSGILGQSSFSPLMGKAASSPNTETTITKFNFQWSLAAYS